MAPQRQHDESGTKEGAPAWVFFTAAVLMVFASATVAAGAVYGLGKLLGKITGVF